ncbi:MAG: YybH family protein, partial [Candidatus Acidiferrales bacterium]
MRSWTRMIRALCVLVGMAGIAALPCFAQTNSQVDAQAIKNVLEQQVAAWNRGDIPAFMDGYWKSDDLEFVNSAGIFQGWQDVLKRYQHSYPDRAAMGHLTFSGLEMHVLCPDTGYVVGHFRLDREKDRPQGVF